MSRFDIINEGSINYPLSFIDLVTNLERFFVAVTNVERLRAKGVHTNRYFSPVVSHSRKRYIEIKLLKVAGWKEDDNDVVCIGNDKFRYGAAGGNEGLVPVSGNGAP